MLPKLAGLRQRSIVNCDNFGRSVSQLCQRALYSVGISSSQLNFIRCRSWRIFLVVNTKGATKPKGSKTDPTMDKMPLWVGGLSLTLMLKPNLSDSILHWTPSARSIGNSSFWSSSLVIPCTRSEPGILSNLFFNQDARCSAWMRLFGTGYCRSLNGREIS